MNKQDNTNTSLKDIIKIKCLGISEKLNAQDTNKRKKIIIVFFVVGLIILFGNILITNSIYESTKKEDIEQQAIKDSLQIIVNEIDLLIQTIDTTSFDFTIEDNKK